MTKTALDDVSGALRFLRKHSQDVAAGQVLRNAKRLDGIVEFVHTLDPDLGDARWVIAQVRRLARGEAVEKP